MVESSCACARWLKARCACARGMVVLVDFVVFVTAGLVVIAIVRRNRHVVHLRMRPYHRRHRATQPACCALAHEALSLSPVWRRDRHVVHLHTRPYRRRLSGNATGMSCACARGLIIVARLATRPACCALAHEALLPSPIWRCDRHVVRLRTRPYCRRPSGNATGMLCAWTLETKSWAPSSQ